MKLPVDVRVTRQRRSKEGFYALINGLRLWHKTRGKAVGSIRAMLELQRLQVVTVRQYAARRKQ
jgi:hypothetical protein